MGLAAQWPAGVFLDLADTRILRAISGALPLPQGPVSAENSGLVPAIVDGLSRDLGDRYVFALVVLVEELMKPTNARPS